jgi:hypothetical protein
MKKSNYLLKAIILIGLLVFLSCNEQKQEKQQNKEANEAKGHMKSDLDLLAINASQYGVQYPETFILMQNRRGIRIEFCVDRGALQLWLSPQAGKSFSYVDKNWSNRDDHTRIFDRILFPELNLNNYDSCDWDAFHSKLYFEDHILHISQVYEEPAVLIWFEGDGLVDFKMYGAPVSRVDNEYIFNHEDRGRAFQSAAVLGEGEGHFQHQRYLDKGRSVHARAHMTPGQVLVIASELEKEKISEKAREIAKRDVNDILSNNEQQIEQDIKYGNFTLSDNPVMQKMLDLNKRFALSMQDFKGFMRSTNQYIYYLLWYRDGGMNTAHLSYTGWLETLHDHVKFALLNPNISYDEPEGRFYGQLMAGPITKWEEDGLFYVVWPAFNYWTQSGDDTYIKGEYLEVMEEAMQWLEDYCFDEDKGLFGRYYHCETPLTGSHGDGWDEATGAPTFKWESDYKGKTIVRSYDSYINLTSYACYMMLSAMTSGEKADMYLEKAEALDKKNKIFFDYDDSLPSYGELLTEKGDFITAEPYGMDIWDYVWGLSLPPFKPNYPEKYKKLQQGIYDFMTTTDEQFFICTYNALLTSMDPFVHDEDKIMDALEYLVDFSATTGKYLNMPYAIPELINVEDGDLFHDVRPLVYSIAPWLSAVTNMGVRRLPFGIALRGTKHLDDITNYQYKESLLDFMFKGEGAIATVVLNGQELKGTLQIPEDRIENGSKNTVEIRMEKDAAYPANLLVSSTVLLKRLSEDLTQMDIEAYGQNILVFSGLNKEIEVLDENGKAVSTTVQVVDDLSYVEFKGRGAFTVSK